MAEPATNGVVQAEAEAEGVRVVVAEKPAQPAVEPVVAVPTAEAEIGITPHAAKFIDTIDTVTGVVGNIGSSEVSDGMLELSRRRTDDMRASFNTFKDHSLDLAITACADDTEGRGRLRKVAAEAQWRKLLAGPFAAAYALMALLCLMMYAAVYFPKLYAVRSLRSLTALAAAAVLRRRRAPSPQPPHAAPPRAVPPPRASPEPPSSLSRARAWQPVAYGKLRDKAADWQLSERVGGAATFVRSPATTRHVSHRLHTCRIASACHIFVRSKGGEAFSMAASSGAAAQARVVVVLLLQLLVLL